MARAVLPSARRASADQVYQDLRGQIVRGDLRPGDVLSEARIGEAHGLSRTPVREVFWRLSEEGFLRVIPQVGTFVAPINVAAVRDSQFIRETLECAAVAEAARHAGPEDAQELRRALADQAEAVTRGDLTAFFALDEAMHRRLMEIAGHPFVWAAIAGAKAQLDRVRYLSLHDGAWARMIVAQHADLIEAVVSGESGAARRIMAEHLRTAFAAIDKIAAGKPGFFEIAAAPGGV